MIFVAFVAVAVADRAEAHQREVIEALTEQDTSELRKQTSLPTPDGPKLWMIKCKV